MLTYEFECEKLSLEPEEERRLQVERDGCIREQRMKIEGLSIHVTTTEYELDREKLSLEPEEARRFPVERDGCITEQKMKSEGLSIRVTTTEASLTTEKQASLKTFLLLSAVVVAASLDFLKDVHWNSNRSNQNKTMLNRYVQNTVSKGASETLRKVVPQAYNAAQVVTFPVALHSLYREYVLPDMKAIQVKEIIEQQEALAKRLYNVENEVVFVVPLVNHQKDLEKRLKTLEDEVMELKLQRGSK